MWTNVRAPTIMPSALRIFAAIVPRWRRRFATAFGRSRSSTTTRVSARKGSCGATKNWRFSPVDFAGAAKAFGCAAFRVEGPGELATALRAALASDRPAVIKVLSDPMAAAPLPGLLARRPRPMRVPCELRRQGDAVGLIKNHPLDPERLVARIV